MAIALDDVGHLGFARGQPVSSCGERSARSIKVCISLSHERGCASHKEQGLLGVDARQLLLNTPLLLENITFEGSCLARIPHLKLEDWNLVDHEQFPHLATDTNMKRVFEKESGVIALEPVESIRRVNKSGLLNLLWVPHYHHSNINPIVIKQFSCRVHDGCLWLNTLIPITDMLIHRITLLPHLGLNLAKALHGKTRERDLVENIKDNFKLVKKPHGYSITSITDSR